MCFEDWLENTCLAQCNDVHYIVVFYMNDCSCKMYIAIEANSVTAKQALEMEDSLGYWGMAPRRFGQEDLLAALDVL